MHTLNPSRKAGRLFYLRVARTNEPVLDSEGLVRLYMSMNAAQSHGTGLTMVCDIMVEAVSNPDAFRPWLVHPNQIDASDYPHRVGAAGLVPVVRPNLRKRTLRIRRERP